MFDKAAKQARLKEIAPEVKRVANNPTLTMGQKNAFLDRAEAEAESIATELENYQRALQFGAGNDLTGDVSLLPETKSVGARPFWPATVANAALPGAAEGVVDGAEGEDACGTAGGAGFGRSAAAGGPAGVGAVRADRHRGAGVHRVDAAPLAGLALALLALPRPG